MPQALPLTSSISAAASRTRKQKVKKAEFGNGYSQTVVDGINSVVDTWTISYENLTTSERNTVVAALDAVGAWDYLTWTAYGDSSQKRFKVTDGWSESFSGTHWSINFTMTQVY